MDTNFDLKLGTCVPGASWAEVWRDSSAKPMLSDGFGHIVKGGVTIVETLYVQPDPYHVPIKHLKLHVAVAGTNPYDILVPVSDITGKLTDFVITMETKVLPEGTKCTEALRDAMIAASFDLGIWPVHEREYASTQEGLFANGKRLASKPFVIAGEVKNQYGERAYILRDESGTRVKVDASQMPLGGYGYLLDLEVYDPIELWFHLSRQWAARSEGEKRYFELEPIRKKHAEAAAEMREREYKFR